MATLGYAVEQWAIDCLREDGGIPAGFQIAHHDEDARAKANRIVCTAKVGEREEGGIRPYNVALEIRLIMRERDAAKVDDYFAVIEDAFKAPAITGADLAEPPYGLQYFQLLEGGEDEKEVEKEARTRARTFNFYALEIN